MPQRFAFDISSLSKWTGPSTGMIRAEHELAKFALTHRPDTVFTIYFSAERGFFQVRPEWAAVLIGFSSYLLGPEQTPLSKRLFTSHRVRFLRLEKRRLLAKSRILKFVYEALQRWTAVGKKHPLRTHGPDGTRLDLVRYEDAIVKRVELQQGDILLLASSDWWHKDQSDIAGIAGLAQTGVRISAICYDILPLTHPEWFGEPAGTNEDIRRFKAYWHKIFPAAATVIVNSDRIRSDVIGYCDANGIALRRLHVIPLGSNRPGSAPPCRRFAELLEPSRFAMFVSTIEPRKNHAMLLRVWKRLLAEKVPQTHRFKLVFVGRRGWKVSEVLAALDDPRAHEGTVVHFENLGDMELEWLYAHCAFCLYPSEYEGFGLPVVEAFARGKAVIASNGGSLAEVVGALSPRLDPKDEKAWMATMRQWVEDPAARVPFEQAIRRDSAVLNWDEVAARVIRTAEDSVA